MTNATLTMLDLAELQQLALNASAGGDSASALAYLKEAVSRPDASGIAHYLLGAEYAQIKMYDRAIGEMEAAIALDPALSTARLQLGMLWLGANDAARAADVLQALEELAEADPLRQFGTGLRHLIREELADALHCLTAGVRLNTGNPALNRDMQSIMQQIEQLQSGTAAAPTEAPLAAAEDSPHILLSAYTGQRH